MTTARTFWGDRGTSDCQIILGEVYMKKHSLGDKIYIITNIIFCLITIIYEGSKYDIRTMKLSEVSGRIKLKCIIFLLLSYLIYTIIKKIITTFKKRRQGDGSN